ncbi:MAG: hypothetical protein ISS19_17410 [Bacteroidales bacterium]|nr:hypothetical protein [Bacteroidales bacterium]
MQLIPYFDKDRDTYYLQSNTILPVPGIEDMIVTASGLNERKEGSLSGPFRKNDDITTFYEKLRDELLTIINPMIRPQKFSRWAGVGSDYRYYHFWYNQEYWDNWSLSYKLWRYDNAASSDKRNKFYIYLELYKKELLNKGLPESNLTEIIEYLKSFKTKGYDFQDEKTAWIAMSFKDQGLTDPMRQTLVDSLKSLIETTKDEVDKRLK